MAIIPDTAFSSVATTVPGQPVSQVATFGQPPLSANFVNFVAATDQQAFASDAAANTPGTTALPPPNNFAFTDLTVKVSGTVPGDAFKGSTPGITSQFIDLTPDNLSIRAVTPNTFIKSDTGNDILIAASGRNILSAGSGANTMFGGTGQDTFLADASTANSVAAIVGFGPGDDVAMLGVSLANFTLQAKDTANGLEIDALPRLASNPISAEIILANFTVADLVAGSKLTMGFSSTLDGKSFLFIHGNN